ncbi:MAG: hypothetical protein DWH98_06950, partial [Planctomycetota bacterium]
MLSPVSYKKMIGVVMPKLFSWLSVCVVLLSGTVVQAEVWRVRQNYTDEGKNLTLANMPDYLEPAAAAANAVFGGTASNDTWNAWDVDARNGNKGGWNYIQGVKTSPWSDGGSGYSTL